PTFGHARRRPPRHPRGRYASCTPGLSGGPPETGGIRGFLDCSLCPPGDRPAARAQRHRELPLVASWSRLPHVQGRNVEARLPLAALGVAARFTHRAPAALVRGVSVGGRDAGLGGPRPPPRGRAGGPTIAGHRRGESGGPGAGGRRGRDRSASPGSGWTALEGARAVLVPGRQVVRPAALHLAVRQDAGRLDGAVERRLPARRARPGPRPARCPDRRTAPRSDFGYDARLRRRRRTPPRGRELTPRGRRRVPPRPPPPPPSCTPRPPPRPGGSDAGPGTGDVASHPRIRATRACALPSARAGPAAVWSPPGST